MKRIWLVGAWLAATLVAVSISAAAVRLVGNQVSDAPTPSSLALETATIGDSTETTLPVTVASITESTTSATDPMAGSTISGAAITTTTGAPGTGTTMPAASSTTAPVAPSTTAPATTTTQPSTTTTTSAGTTTTTSAGTTTTTDAGTSTTAATTGPFTFQTGSQPASTVTVFCTGDDVSLSGATPAAGYSATVEKAGPDEVRVEFDPTNGGSEWEIRVKCDGGVPEEEIDEN